MNTKTMGLPSMILMCLNGTIGAGLFLLPGTLYSLTGTWGILIYMFVGAIVLSIAWCFAQCATVFQRNGGAYVYAREAFGNFIGFEVGIMRLVSVVIAWATLAVGFCMALGAIFPVVLLTPFKQMLIIGLIMSLGVVNLFSIRVLQSLNNIVTIAKLFPLFGLISAGFFFINPSHLLDFNSIAVNTHTVGSGAILIFFAFAGFETLTIAAAEMKNPKKNVPIALMVAISLSTIIYLLVHLLCIGLLGPSLAESTTPFADIAYVIFGNYTQLIIVLATLIAIGGVTIVSSFIVPRICVALAQDQLIPRCFIKYNAFGSPYVAILLSTLVTCVIAVSGNFVQLVTISVVSRFTQYISTCLALFIFDKKGILKSFNRPWKKIIPTFGLIGIGWLLLQTDIDQLFWGCGALICALPFYFLQRKKMNKQNERA